MSRIVSLLLALACLFFSLTSCNGAQPTRSAPAIDYVLNTNTGKFHYPDCASVDQIRPEHRLDFSGDREEVIARGYQPCKKCNP